MIKYYCDKCKKEIKDASKTITIEDHNEISIVINGYKSHEFCEECLSFIYSELDKLLLK